MWDAAIRIDTRTLEWFRAQVEAQGGGSYQALINEALREYIANQQESWEETLGLIQGAEGVLEP